MQRKSIKIKRKKGTEMENQFEVKKVDFDIKEFLDKILTEEDIEDFKRMMNRKK